MKDIVGFEGLYGITSCGRVWSYRQNKFMKPSFQKGGYWKINLRKDGRVYTRQIHRLVAEAYIPNPNDLPVVNHKDEIKTNNCVNNLEWCSIWYNTVYSIDREKALEKGAQGEREMKETRKNNCKKVKCIETGQIFESGKAAAIAMGVDPSHLSKVCRGKANTTGGYHFEFVVEE